MIRDIPLFVKLKVAVLAVRNNRWCPLQKNYQEEYEYNGNIRKNFALSRSRYAF